YFVGVPSSPQPTALHVHYTPFIFQMVLQNMISWYAWSLCAKYDLAGLVAVDSNSTGSRIRIAFGLWVFVRQAGIF
ncbi:MAG: hypothetical protein MI799_10240, partial [Desulfobacterales bacterium]|nr:hypothetical protein [Desulfobacterales bacterium]